MEKKVIGILAITMLALLFGCTSQPDTNQPIIGGDKDSHGCLIAAGYSWCEEKQKCLRAWEEQCTGTTACTEEALICPDGSGVGRTGTDCHFSPCPNCSCPEGFVQEGDVCNPGCYYGNPRCMIASVKCTPTTGSGASGTALANPASVNCINHGGVLSIVTDENGGQTGMCTLPSGEVCEEWAYLRGKC